MGTQTSENKSNNSYLNDCEITQRKSKKKCKNFKNWNDIEDKLLQRLFRIYGNKWKIIGKHFLTRTPYQLCYRIKTLDENEKILTEEKKIVQNSTKSPSENFLQKKKNFENFPENNSRKLFPEIVENSFFEKLENLEKIFEASKISMKKEENDIKVLGLNEISAENSEKSLSDLK